MTKSLQVHHSGPQGVMCMCAQGRALLRKLEGSPDWGQITAISRHPDPDLAGTRVNFLPLDLLDSEARPHRSAGS